jgi:hypothetical protein
LTACPYDVWPAAKIEDMRREIGVSSGSAGVDELQLIELIDEGTYGKVFRGELNHNDCTG